MTVVLSANEQMVSDARPDPDADTYSTAEVAHLLGVTYRKLDYWSKAYVHHGVAGIVRPSNAADHPVSKPGWSRVWTRDDVRVVAVVARLLDFTADNHRGVAPNWAAIDRHVRANPTGWLVIDATGPRIGVTHDPAEAVAWTLACDCAVTVNLSGLPCPTPPGCDRPASEPALCTAARAGSANRRA